MLEGMMGHGSYETPHEQGVLVEINDLWESRAVDRRWVVLGMEMEKEDALNVSGLMLSKEDKVVQFMIGGFHDSMSGVVNEDGVEDEGLVLEGCW